MSKKILVIGPSHVKRLEHAFHLGIIPQTELTVEFFGRDGMPVWHPLLSKQLHKSDYDHILVIVGDFRFGNKIFAETIAKNTGGVAKDLINQDNDQKLYQKSLATLDEWIEIFGNKIRFLFWDLLGREFVNRRDNKYVLNNQYRHPTWNYDVISDRYRNHIIDVGFLKNWGMNRLVVDSANHFSMFAYLFLYDMLQSVEQKNVFKQSELDYKFQILDDKYQHLPIRDVYLICDPPIFRRLNAVFNSNAWPKHTKLYLLTIQDFIARKKSLILAEDVKILYLSSFRALPTHDNTEKYQRFIATLRKLDLDSNRFKIVFFDYACDYVFELRKKQKNLPFCLPDPSDDFALENLQASLPNILSYPVDNYLFLHSLFELSGRLPNFKGLLFLITSISLEQPSPAWFDLFYDHFIKELFTLANTSLSVTTKQKIHYSVQKIIL